MKKFLNEKEGFTLIELAVVMAIIAMLALLIIGAIMAARKAQKRTIHRKNAQIAQSALEAFYTKNQTYLTNPPMTNFTLGTVFGYGGPLEGEGKINQTGGCSNGGGLVTSNSNSYTITILDSDCLTSIGTLTNN